MIEQKFIEIRDVLLNEASANDLELFYAMIEIRIKELFDILYDKNAIDNILIFPKYISPYTFSELLDYVTNTEDVLKLNNSKIISMEKKTINNFPLIKLNFDDGMTIDLPILSSKFYMEILRLFSEEEKQIQREEKNKNHIHFENEDIIITDPCYIIKKGTNDWENSNYGEKMGYLGIKNYIQRDTIYGDWSCSTFDSDTNKEIGKFCADAGKVAVFSLKEVLDYNPEYDVFKYPHTVTLIKNFTGDVKFEVFRKTGIFENDGDFHKKGTGWIEDRVAVIGRGNINFYTKQTGF